MTCEIEMATQTSWSEVKQDFACFVVKLPAIHLSPSPLNSLNWDSSESQFLLVRLSVPKRFVFGNKKIKIYEELPENLKKQNGGELRDTWRSTERGIRTKSKLKDLSESGS